MATKPSLGDELRNIASDIEGLENDYDNLVAELEEDKNEIDRLRETLEELNKYIDWAESYYPDMLNQYQALLKLGGD